MCIVSYLAVQAYLYIRPEILRRFGYYPGLVYVWFSCIPVIVGMEWVVGMGARWVIGEMKRRFSESRIDEMKERAMAVVEYLAPPEVLKC
jgi:hypothetical protein